MPAALQEHHRELIYKGRHRETLLKEPGVTVTMDDGEQVKLEPMNPFHKPNKRHTVKKLVDIMSNTTDDAVWSNLPAFLNGIVLAKVDLPPYFYEKIVRKAGEIGKERIVLTCAERSEETGLRLSRRGIAKELMLAFHDRAVRADFQGPELEAAAQRAEKVARMLEDEMHKREKLKAGETDARTSPLVLGVLLELAAARAVHKFESKDQDGKVASYASRMLNIPTFDFLLREEKTVGYITKLLASEPESESRRHRQLGYDADALGKFGILENFVLQELLPIQNGIKLALEVDSIASSPFKSQLQARLELVDERVQRSVERLVANKGGKPRRGLVMFDELTGSDLSSVIPEPAEEAAIENSTEDITPDSDKKEA